MSRGARRAVLLAGLALLGGMVVWGMTGLPSFGDFHGRYGQILAASTVNERHATNAVVVITFDYRGVDTLVEELILFIAAVGVALLLRSEREEEEKAAEEAARTTEPHTSESLRWVGGGLVAPLALLGTYIVTHGGLSPGGGFQGGVILMAAVLIVLLTGRYAIAVGLRGETWVEALEALGAAGFVLLGLGGLIAGGALLQNFLPKGPIGLLTSGGTIPVANASVGLEVAGALLVVAAELVEPRRLVRRDQL